jgi:hypothetical protein
LISLLPAAGLAAEVVLPATALERDALVTAIYRTNGQATGKGTLFLRWTDILGRVVEERQIPVELTDESEIRYPLDMRRAVAMANTLTARFTFDGVNQRGPVHREENATVDFVANFPSGLGGTTRSSCGRARGPSALRSSRPWASTPPSSAANPKRLPLLC